MILPADSIASVIEVKSTLSKKELKDAVTKVASVKKLKRSSITNIDQPVTFSELIVNSTFGVVFAYDSKTSLNTLASNLRELNAELPSSQWTDLVVVLGKGVLGYYIQYPGEESLLGQLMPPASEKFVKFPYYVLLSISEDPQYAVNRFFATLMAQLTFFRKRSFVPLDPMLQGATNNVKRVQEYWLNSKGKLKEVPNSHCGEGPEPNWSFNVFVANTQHILGRISQHTWADGYIYQVTPTSYEANRLLGYIAELNQKDPVHIFPSKDKLKGLTSILSGIPPTSEEIKKHIINFSNGNIEAR